MDKHHDISKLDFSLRGSSSVSNSQVSTVFDQKGNSKRDCETELKSNHDLFEYLDVLECPQRESKAQIITEAPEKISEMELKSPVGKRGRWRQGNPSLPLFGDAPVNEKFLGYFTGSSVVIMNPSHIQTLYSQGFFGKGSLSRSFPNFGKEKEGIPPIISEQQWKRRKDWEAKLESLFASHSVKNAQKDEKDEEVVIVDESDEDSKKSTSETSVDVIEVEVDKKSKCDDITIIDDDSEDCVVEINKTEAENVGKTEDLGARFLVIDRKENEDSVNVESFKPHIEKMKIPIVVEEMHLLLEEAFFLTFALGCLSVSDMGGQTLDIGNMWVAFNIAQEDFVESYVAYHYFRAKGWVVKSGLKFGGRFLLYKDGPSYYHATYIVRIQNINKQSKNQNNIQWGDAITMQRMAETSNKDVLMCQILWPDDLSEMQNPNILKSFRVSEMLLRRWQPCREKDEDNFYVE